MHSVNGYLASSYIAHVCMFYSRQYVQQICKWTVPFELYYLVVLCLKFVVDLSVISEVFLNLVFISSNDLTCFIRAWYSLCAWTLNPDSTIFKHNMCIMNCQETVGNIGSNDMSYIKGANLSFAGSLSRATISGSSRTTTRPLHTLISEQSLLCSKCI